MCTLFGCWKSVYPSGCLMSLSRLLNAPKTWIDKYRVQDGLLYYLSGKSEDIRLRLDGTYGSWQTHDPISRKYYWPESYKEFYKYVNVCKICQSRSSKQNWEQIFLLNPFRR